MKSKRTNDVICHMRICSISYPGTVGDKPLPPQRSDSEVLATPSPRGIQVALRTKSHK